MIRKLVIGVVLAVALSAAAGNAYAITSPGAIFLGTDVAPGLFCEVEKLDVCVMARTEEDCTKLGGVKADSCSMAEKAEDKN